MLKKNFKNLMFVCLGSPTNEPPPVPQPPHLLSGFEAKQLSLYTILNRIRFCEDLRDSFNQDLEKVGSNFRVTCTSVSHKIMFHLLENSSVYVSDYKIEIDRKEQEEKKKKQKKSDIGFAGQSPAENDGANENNAVDYNVILPHLNSHKITAKDQSRLQAEFRVAAIASVYLNAKESAPNNDPSMIAVPVISRASPNYFEIINQYREGFAGIAWTHIPASERYKVIEYYEKLEEEAQTNAANHADPAP